MVMCSNDAEDPLSDILVGSLNSNRTSTSSRSGSAKASWVGHRSFPPGVADYADDIAHYQRQRDLDCIVPYWFDAHPELTSAMRRSAVDLLSKCSRRCRLRCTTHYLATRLFDRFMSGLANVSPDDVNTKAVAALYVASKVEEVTVYTGECFADMCKVGTGAELYEAEVSLLSVLGFNVTIPTHEDFFERCRRLVRCSAAQAHRARYLVELSLLEPRSMRMPASLCVAASVAAACVDVEGFQRIASIRDATGWDGVQILSTARWVLSLVVSDGLNCDARIKFASKSFLSVACAAASHDWLTCAGRIVSLDPVTPSQLPGRERDTTEKQPKKRRVSLEAVVCQA
mmetsp:Transcript_56383/g.123562  ORF Transcript_56383/g.123562 Transcript_56383/m.123562 type:complete len:343 (+) Transcript_56383:388-1416(+)